MYKNAEERSKDRRIRIMFLILTVSLLVVGYIYYEFEYRGMVEIPTNATSTSTRPLYSMEAFRKELRHYPKLYKATLEAPVDSKSGTYVIPGLHSTETLSSNKANDTSICTSMTPQGIAVCDEYIFVSAYCHTKQHNSVIYVIDRDTHRFIKEIVLPGKPHVGSLAYDDDRDNLWVCGSGSGLAQANAISLDRIKEYSLRREKKPISYVFQNYVLEIRRSSFMTYKDDHLYIGYFHSSQNGVLKKYAMELGGNIQNTIFQLNGMDIESGLAITSATIPKQTQGMAFYYDKLFMSQSLGILPSQLVLFDDSINQGKEYQKDAAMLSFKLPRMLEQIYIYDDQIYMLFESAAYAYRDLPSISVDRILTMNISELRRLVNEELQEQQEARKQEIRMKKEAMKTVRWRKLSKLPWITKQVEFLSPHLLPEKKWKLFS